MQHKKHLFSTLLFACYMLTSINAQNLQINFTGSGLSTTVDSVQVLNIAKGTSVTVKSTEGLQLIGTSTDIETHLSGIGNLRIFPNPMTETSEIEFSNFRESQVNVEVFDVTGKIVLRNQQHLIQGNHKFEISGLNPGIYLVNVRTFDGKYTAKLLSNGTNLGTPAISYKGTNNSSVQKSDLKSTKDLVQMQYNAGERLLLKGISGNYARVLTLIPTQNQAVNFAFIACTDADGKHYAVVTIGTQTWMAENLAWLPMVSPSSKFSLTDPYYYVYGYQGTNVTEAKATSNYKTYGVLYNWPAAMNACPAGWHLPTDAEWTTFENYLIASGYNYDGTTTENKIAKSLATSGGWRSSSNTGAVGNTDYPGKINATGFSALPGGYRLSVFNDFQFTGLTDFWWSASENSSYDAWGRYLYCNDDELVRTNSSNKDNGVSVRCLRD